MIPVSITREMIERMKERVNTVRSFNGSTLNNKGKIYGFLGEEMFLGTFLHSNRTETFDYDLTLEGCKVDVKTKLYDHAMKPYYHLGIDAKAVNQKTEFYAFCQILAPYRLINNSIQEILSHPYERGFILGYLTKNDFFKKARFYKKGEPDDDNGTVYRDDYYCFHVDQLCQFDPNRTPIKEWFPSGN